MTDVAIQLVIILTLLLVNGFLAASELALVSVSKARVRHMAEEGHRTARTVVGLTEDPNRFLAAIQVGITLSGFFASAIGATTLVAVLAEALQAVPVRFVA